MTSPPKSRGSLSALEGPNSPIDAILAEQTARDTATMPVKASDIDVAMPTQEPAGRKPRRSHPRTAIARIAPAALRASRPATSLA